MVRQGLSLRVERVQWSFGPNLWCAAIRVDGEEASIATPLSFIPLEKHGAFTTPTFELTAEAAQELMDDLWRCGLRPTEGTGSAGAYAAQTRHLEDMRALVFKTKPNERNKI